MDNYGVCSARQISNEVYLPQSEDGVSALLGGAADVKTGDKTSSLSTESPLAYAAVSSSSVGKTSTVACLLTLLLDTSSLK